jgi:hypothetical protein
MRRLGRGLVVDGGGLPNGDDGARNLLLRSAAFFFSFYMGARATGAQET